MSAEDLNLIGSYLRGELSSQQIDSFRSRLAADTNFMQQFELEKMQFEALGETAWSKASTKTPEYDRYLESAASQQIKSLHDKLKARGNTATKKSVPIYRIPAFKWAAAVVLALLLFASLLLGGRQNPEALYAQYFNLEDIPSLAVRNGQDSILVSLEALYLDGKYQRFLSEADKAPDLKTANASMLLYYGLASLENDQLERAIQSFDALINSSFIDAERGHWFKALALLKMNNTTQAKKVLNHIVTNQTYNAQQAKELLDKLD